MTEKHAWTNLSRVYPDPCLKAVDPWPPPNDKAIHDGWMEGIKDYFSITSTPSIKPKHMQTFWLVGTLIKQLFVLYWAKIFLRSSQTSENFNAFPLDEEDQHASAAVSANRRVKRWPYHEVAIHPEISTFLDIWSTCSEVCTDLLTLIHTLFAPPVPLER